MNISPIPNRTIDLESLPVEKVTFIGPMMIDDDGAGPSEGDPDYQPDTTLHFKGLPLNAEQIPYIVVPPCIIQRTAGIVMGCQGKVTRISTQQSVMVVVADRGPRFKAGEASIATANALDVPSSPTGGGDDSFDYLYEIWPGQPAVVNGITYDLQKS